VKLITRDTDYAIRALCFISQSKEKIVSVSSLVKELRIPQPFLRKILQVLNKKGILKSHKGVGGGFQLSTSANNIFLIDLIKTFQGPLSLNECFFKKKICPNRSICALKKKIDAIEKDMLRKLESISIASLLK